MGIRRAAEDGKPKSGGRCANSFPQPGWGYVPAEGDNLHYLSEIGERWKKRIFMRISSTGEGDFIRRFRRQIEHLSTFNKGYPPLSTGYPQIEGLLREKIRRHFGGRSHPGLLPLHPGRDPIEKVVPGRYFPQSPFSRKRDSKHAAPGWSGG
jgi:hypothetical protein